MKKCRVAALVGATALSLALTACGGSASEKSANEEGLTKINLAAMPVSDLAPIYLGVEKGFFKEEGLDLNPVPSANTPASLSGVISGDFQIAFGTSTAVMLAREQNFDVKFVCGASQQAENGISAVIVPKDSDIKTPADLAGKTVSVHAVSNVGDISIRKVVRDDGGDPKSIKFVEVSFPDVEAALKNGQIDAGWSNDPFLTKSLLSGDYRVISHPFYDVDPKFPASGYMALTEYTEKHPDTIAAFKRALERSNKYALKNPDEVRRVLGDVTEIDPAILSKMVLPAYTTEIDRDVLKEYADAVYEFGAVKHPVNVDDMLLESK